MKKYYLITILLFNIFLVSKAQYANLKISAFEVMIAKETYLGNDGTIVLKNNSSKEEVEIYNKNGLIILATFKLSTNNGVRRSNLKSSAVNVNINYKIYYQNDKKKVKTKRIFYLDDDKKFTEEQKVFFQYGIKNTLIKIKYLGKLI
jgi:hypothetical protein